MTGADVGQGREMVRDRAVPTAEAGRLDEWLRSRLGLRLREVTLGQFLPFLGPRFPSVKLRG